MKTETKSAILKMIERGGKVRPAELQESLKITPQTVHYHLRNLVRQGLIEAKGSVPFTQYSLAGIPDLEAVAHWLSVENPVNNPDLICDTRDVFTARLPRLKAFVYDGLDEKILPRVISTAGEIGNNSFDHNMGQWKDMPGCWFETQATGKYLWVCIADRGQGIFKTLVKVHSDLADEQTALEAAFETVISGRSPERRGNGLKFVRENILNAPGGGIACFSGNAKVEYGEHGDKCLVSLKKYLDEVQGTITLMSWGLK